MAKKHNVPEKVGEVLREIGLTPQSAGWDCHGTFVLLHKALEKVAAHKNVRFDPPQIIANDVGKKEAVMLVVGHLGDKTEWSVGEAAPYNNKNSYPFAMAEKRAKDRVILKLVGLHGDVYSEEEAEEFKAARPAHVSAEANAEAANSTQPASGGSPKLDEAFTAPSIAKETDKAINDSEMVKAVFQHFPNAKITSVKPTKEGFAQFAAACKEALAGTKKAENAHAVLDELRACQSQYGHMGKAVTGLVGKLYNDCYVPACERLGAEANPLTQQQDQQIAV